MVGRIIYMHLQYFFLEIFITEIVVHLLNTINFSRREFVIWSPAHQHGSISSHQGERQALEQLPPHALHSLGAGPKLLQSSSPA